ncbi:MAG TPA: HAMP domain-containing sensor histidine kinase [Alphaproteobacteria bacterium]|jgi:signal transduction histidine kinase|nr:HAMP domain-containing sensor histidine kinase [Alphaproteobacteria bacterium]
MTETSSSDKDYSDLSRDELIAELEAVTHRLNETQVLAAVHGHQESVLRVAKEQAEWESRSKSEFIASMSHELRTPLNSVIGFAEVIHDELLGPLGSSKYGEYAGDILSSGRHLLELVDDIIDISTVEAGTIKLVKERIDLAEMFETCVALVRERAAESGVELSFAIGEDVPTLLADAVKLKRMLLNLLTNAIKFTPADGRVTVGADLGARDAVCITVADTGIGIAAEEIERVLEPFGQANLPVEMNREGIGLGLYLTKSLIYAHGGWLDISSDVDRGTSITLTFPSPGFAG